MELWLLFAILAHLSYSISTSIDKHMMNYHYEIVKTDMVKMFFDGLILLFLGLIFFNLQFSETLIFGSLILGFLYAVSGIIYYKTLELEDVGEVIPFLQSASVLLVFIGSLTFLGESVSTKNYIGVFLIVGGVYAVICKDKLRYPKLNKVFFLILMTALISMVYFLLVKKFVSNSEPIALAIMMYFSCTLFLLIYELLFRKRIIESLYNFKSKYPTIIIASFFGALGTFLIYSALSLGDAARVYPVAGLESVFVFIIAWIFLKEKIGLYRLIGTITVFFGIFLVSI